MLTEGDRQALEKEGYCLLVKTGKFACYPSDPQRKVLTPSGRVCLSEQEFRLFLHFISRPMEPLSHKEIQDIMGWHHLDEYEAHTRELTARLRKRIGDKDRVFIKTEKAYGFYFDPEGTIPV